MYVPDLQTGTAAGCPGSHHLHKQLMNCLTLQSFKPNQISWGTDVAEDVQLDEEKLKEALKKQKEFEAQAVETNERKRKYNSFKDDGAAPTEEEVSALPLQLFSASTHNASSCAWCLASLPGSCSSLHSPGVAKSLPGRTHKVGYREVG